MLKNAALLSHFKVILVPQGPLNERAESHSVVEMWKNQDTLYLLVVMWWSLGSIW